MCQAARVCSHGLLWGGEYTCFLDKETALAQVHTVNAWVWIAAGGGLPEAQAPGTAHAVSGGQAPSASCQLPGGWAGQGHEVTCQVFLNSLVHGNLL